MGVIGFHPMSKTRSLIILIASECHHFKSHAKKKNLTLLHQNQQIQHLNTTTCGYFCLYFLKEMHKGTDYFDLLQVFDFDTDKNEKFIADYFKNM